MAPPKDKTKLPEHLLVIYSRYKHDTEIIAGWLAKYAAKAGYKSEYKDDPRTTPKLTGRARKLARDRAKAGIDTPYKYTVRLDEFTKMAVCIVAYRPVISLSDKMQRVFTRTIQARRKCGEYFRSNSKGNAVDNDKHRYFANLLEKTLDILRPCFSSAAESPDINSKHSVTPETGTKSGISSNLFALLQEDEALSQEYAQESETEQEEHEKKECLVVAKVQLDESELEAEFIFAIWSFLQELRSINLMIQATWLQYFKGNVELMQAGLVTNTAIDLVRRAEAEFDIAMKRPTKYPAAKYPTSELPLLIFYEHLDRANGGPLEFDLDHPQGLIICGCDVCELTMYVPYTMSRIYLRVIKDLKRQEVIPGDEMISMPEMPSVGTICKAELYDSNNPSEVAFDRMREFLPDLICGAILHKDHFLEDEILHAARHIYHKRTIPLWTSFAFSVQLGFCDLQQIFNTSPMKDLRNAVKDARLRYTLHCEYSAKAGVQLWTRDAQYEELITDFERWTVTNKLGLMAGPNKALKNFFLTIATIKLQLFLEINLLGRSLTYNVDHIMMMAHLYNAARIVDTELPAWPDIELFIAIQGPEHVFVGGRPTDLTQAHRKLQLACGAKIRSFASDAHRRPSKCDFDLDRRRTTDVTAITKNLLDRCIGAETRVIDECTHELQKLLLSTKYAKSINRLTWPQELNEVKAVGLGISSSLGTAAYGTIKGLHHAFSVEAPAFAFDYFSMYRRCRDMMAQIFQGYKNVMDESISNRQVRITTHDLAPILAMEILGSAVAGEESAAFLRQGKKTAQAGGHGPVQTFLSLSSEMDSPHYRKMTADFAHRIATRGLIAAAADLCITKEGAMATMYLKPVINTLKLTFETKNQHDAEIKVLRKIRGETTYGEYLFREHAMKSLYGEGREREWRALIMQATPVMFNKDKDPCSVENILQLIVFTKLVKVMRMRQGSKKLDKTQILSLSVEHYNKELKVRREKEARHKANAKTDQSEEDQNLVDGLGSWFS